MTRTLSEMIGSSSAHKFDESLKYVYEKWALFRDYDKFFDHDISAFVRLDPKELRNVKSCQLQFGLVSKLQYEALRQDLAKYDREYQVSILWVGGTRVSLASFLTTIFCVSSAHLFRVFCVHLSAGVLGTFLRGTVILRPGGCECCLSRFIEETVRNTTLTFQKQKMLFSLRTGNFSWDPEKYTNLESGTWRRGLSLDNMMVLTHSLNADQAKAFQNSTAYGGGSAG